MSSKFLRNISVLVTDSNGGAPFYARGGPSNNNNGSSAKSSATSRPTTAEELVRRKAVDQFVGVLLGVGHESSFPSIRTQRAVKLLI
jgi:hypothetical protein